MGGHVVRAAIARAGIDPAEVDDCIFGAAAQQGTQAYNIGRLCGIAGGLPDTVAGMSIERQCSSGLMSIATAAKSIMCNEYDIAVAGGVESISLVQTKHKNAYRNVSTDSDCPRPDGVHADAGDGGSGVAALQHQSPRPGYLLPAEPAAHRGGAGGRPVRR